MAKAPSKYTNDELRLAAKIAADVGIPDYQVSNITDQLPAAERPPLTENGNVYITVTFPRDWDPSATAMNKVNKAVKEAWKPVVVPVGKVGTVKIEVGNSYSDVHVVEW